MYFCHVVGVEPVKWASPVDMTGHYGATHVKCDIVLYGPNTPYGLAEARKFFQLVLRLLEL